VTKWFGDGMSLSDIPSPPKGQKSTHRPVIMLIALPLQATNKFSFAFYLILLCNK
jgi:hypothetical protein